MLADRTFNLNVKEKRGMKEKTKPTIAVVLGTILLFTPSIHAQRYMENLSRGIVAVNLDGGEVYVGWRMLGTDPNDIAFNLYRNDTKINSEPITDSTNYVDDNGSTSALYHVRAVINGEEQESSKAVEVWNQQYLSIPIQIPPGGTTPDGGYTYSDPDDYPNAGANDCSVGDLDGDGEYEIVLKWDPSNSKDNAQSGYTGNVYLDAYEMNGTLMWRIDLGINIRAGAHYTQFMVYDLDSDGRAEVACKTAPGTKDGLGHNVILLGDDPNKDWRSTTGSTRGKILSGPEYLTIFDGLTGAELVTTNYIPPRGTASNWGDSTGNRVDRFLACVAYLDGVRPSLVMCRGYYTRTVLAAWDWRNSQLTPRWVFDTGFSGGPWSAWKGQGNHNLSVGDVDGDGKDEIVYGACAIDDDGTGLYTTGLGHGDAMHLSDMDPTHPGLEVFDVHESPSSYGIYGGEFRAAGTGLPIYGIDGHGGEVGRGCAFDIEPDYPGFEAWTSTTWQNPDGTTNYGYIYDSQGNIICNKPSNMFINFGIWWDADLLRELLDGTTISDWNYTTHGRQNLVYAPTGVTSNNDTKKTPCLSGDILGDWREEVIWRRSDNTALQLWTTKIVATNRIYTLMHDPQYRLSIAWQNVTYNQPPHTGFYLGYGMAEPPHPHIRVLYGDFTGDNIVDVDDIPYFTDFWLVDCNDVGVDFNGDGIINFYEFSLLARNWLKGVP